jgi:hypothetical protein
MGGELRLGDRVRITRQRQVYGYPAGCQGIVCSGPTTRRSGKTYYGVRMDKDEEQDVTLLLAEEIEADGGRSS